MKVENGKTYIGVVEDNNDPKKLGRVKVRVLDVFDNTPLENIPWANPWKDLAGDEFSLPDKGKIVTVVFEGANINNPEFIYSDHYNVNLEKKISQLSESDYLSMKSLIFDHKTQIYVNDSEGLKLDHKFNLINIKDKSIDVNLKDNFGKINLGTANSTQRIILGDNFLNWFDDFVKILMGDQGGPFLGNLGAPVVATPALLGSLQLYQQMKDPKFLSKNVYAVDNENVAKLDRIAEGQKGDDWQSTVVENKLTSKEPVPYTATEGSTDTTFDQPKSDAPISPTQSVVKPDTKPTPTENPDVKVLLRLLENKKYKLYEGIGELNIVAVRTQCQKVGDKYTDQFVDKLYILFKKDDGLWELKQYMISTVPGLEFTVTDSWLAEKNMKSIKPWSDMVGKKVYMKEYATLIGGLPILVPSQYIDVYYISQYKGDKSFEVIDGASQLVWRDKDSSNIDIFNPSNLEVPELVKPNALSDSVIRLHRGYPGGKNVGNWSEGSQVFSSAESLNEFFSYCEKHKEKYGNKFTYTLTTKNDWDEAAKNVDSDKSASTLSSTSGTSGASSNVQSNTNSSSGTTGVSNSSSGTSGNTISELSNQNKSEYIIGLLNPTTDLQKKISGKINISKSGNNIVSTGSIFGLPNGTIGPVSDIINNSQITSNDSLAENIIHKLEDEIMSKYNVKVKIVVIDKK